MNDIILEREEIAVIGLAGRFPGADDAPAFWQNLVEGVESIRPFSEEELRAAGVDAATLNHPDFVNAGAVMNAPEDFDAAFFGMSPREAEITDPQHRVFLECAWAALENAAYDPERYDGLISVYGGVAPNTYFQENVSTHRDLLDTLGRYPVMIGNEREYAVTRVSFKFDLKGPSFSVNTACSTSGVAVHLACQSLLSGECDLALAGGARVRVPSKGGYLYQENGILSPDGKCRAFDAEARGTVVGNGVAMLVLKRLSDALKDGDNIRAVIKATAINNDGANKVGFTAPSVQGQAAAIAEAQALADLSADSISYIEAHGTATSLGDPIEIAALTKAFRETTDAKGFCAIGSVKTNIGHLDAGAGAAGMIKTVMALEHKQIPASLNFERPNPQIDFANSPFYVNDRLRDWPASDGHPRRAGVSSFGLGGTNAHVILEEAPQTEASGPSRPYQLFMLSARSESALDKASDNLANHLEMHTINLADAAYTLQVGRKAFSERQIVVAADKAEAGERLREKSPLKRIRQSAPEGAQQVAFMFAGGGAQYVNMARDIYESEPLYRHWLDRCAEIVKPLIGRDLRELLFPDEAGAETSQALLESPSLALPTLLATEYALSQLWMSWGIQPSAVIGHSAGEYCAACLAGVISLEDALAIVTKRGQLFETLPEGAMLSVPLSPDELKPLIGDLSFAAINRPDMCVVSGPNAEIEALHEALEAREIDASRLHISVAAHSQLVEPILDEFRAFLETIQFSAPQLPLISNVHGDWADPEDVQTPDYWVRHLRQTVKFSEGLSKLFENTDTILLEVGPGQVLSAFARHHPANEGQSVVASSRHPREAVSDLAFLLTSLGRLWLAGADIDWRAFYRDERRLRLPLPSYPFERQRYWLEPATRVTASAPQIPHDVSQVIPPQPGPERQTLVPAPAAPSANRKDRVARELKSIISDLSGLEPAAMDEAATFLELGLDSLLLTQVSTAIKKTFKVRVSFRQLFEDAPTISALSEFIDGKLAPDAFPDETPQPAPVAAPQAQTAAPQMAQPLHQMPAAQAGLSLSASGEGAGALERIMSSQLQLMAEQLRMLQGGAPAAQAATQMPQTASQRTSQGAAPQVSQTPLRAPTAKAKAKPEKAAAGTAIGPVGDVKRASGEDMSAKQRAYLDDFIQRYTMRTRSSKDITQDNRPFLADAVTVYGFSPLWKELTYLIHLERSAGARVWDIDGNAYVDLTMGFGSNLLGHSPEFVTEAVQKQLEKGVELCGISPLAGEVAELMKEMTGLERFAFANSGSEAVLGALRLARTVTGKDKIVTFTGAYHGRYDAVLIGSLNVRGERRSISQVPGVTDAVAEDTIVLTYGDPDAFEVIREHADEIAAVIVEPVQSRNPDIQPREFLHGLRELTKKLDIAFIFDEVITGFRAHQGGAQAYFGIEADIASYGKAMGGGMPIAMVGGKAEYMDAFDGGMWQYGDDSFPEAGVTFLGGTFIRHPVALASSHAALSYLKEQGPALQIELNERTAKFAGELNDHFEKTSVPIRLSHFSSWFVFKFLGDQPYSGLFFPLLRDKGVHVYESSRCFLSTAHTDEDLAFMSRVIKEVAADMQAEGFLSGPEGGSPQGGQAVKEDSTPERELVTVLADGSRQMPLTEAQREIWLATIFGDDASMAYNISFSLELKGDLKQDLLEDTLQKVVARHEALRTTISPEGDYQRIANRLKLELPRHDLSTLDDTAQQEELKAFAHKHAASPFDFVNGPLLRCDLLKLKDDRHVLVLSAHHIVCDGWSIGVVLEEIGALYSAAVQGEKVDLGPPMQFREYVAWQRGPDAAGDIAEAESYWLEQFKDPPPILQLPTDHPRPPIKTYDAERAQLKVSPAFYKDLKRFSKDNGSTLFNVLLTGCEILLYRLSGQGDLTVGITSAGQTMVDGEALVGHCVNMLPIRTRLDAAQSARDCLAQVRGAVLDAFEHRNFTYGTLLGKLSLPRDPSRAPLISATFNLDPAMEDFQFEGLEAGLHFNPRRYENFDLFFNCLENAGDLVLEITYNSNLFDKDTMQRWLGHYQTLLGSFMANPEAKLSELNLLSEAERERLLFSWNDTVLAYPREATLPQLFEAQVAKTPEATALHFRGEKVNFSDLNTRANRLAHYLQGMGVKPGVAVAICVARSSDMVVALLAILKAGGAYVPLDPNYPIERIRFMLENSGAKLLLTEKTSSVGLPTEQVQTLYLDALPDLPDKTENPTSDLQADDPAYIMYTSGSTGLPKGVVGLHRGAVNRFHWMWAHYPFEEGEIGAQKTTLSFVDAVWEIFGPLLQGIPIVTIPDEELKDPFALVEVLARHKVTRIVMVPSLLRVLLETHADLGEQLPHLKLWVSSGEALSFDLAQRFKQVMPDRTLLNLYGSSEVAADVTAYEIPSPLGYTRVPIGKPIGNTEIYILDTYQNPVPIGVPGEIYAAGDGLAAGYHARPDLTAERFIPHLFKNEAGARLFRTGDLGRYLPDGNIDYLGRKDFQVKVRGFRIELGEVEAALNAHPQIDQAIVMVKKDDYNEPFLVAYAIADNKAVTVSDLRSFLKQTLPDYMVPAAFIPLDAFPLTPNGKVDRRALPVPDRAKGPEPTEPSHVAPRNPTEMALAELWAESLNLERVSVFDNFFELGGDSMLVMRILAKARQAGLQLSAKQFFEHQTIAALAPHIREQAPVIAEQGFTTGPVPLTAGQIRFLEERDSPDPHHWNIATLFVSEEALEPAHLETALNHILQHHDALRLRFEEIGGTWQQVNVSPEKGVPFSSTDLSNLAEGEQISLIEETAATLQASLNLSEGPMLRVAHFRLGAGKPDRLLVIIHHFVADALSWSIFWQDFQSAYEQAKADKPVVLPPKSTSFKAWSERLERYAQSDELKARIKDWLKLPWAKVKPLPLDFPEHEARNTNASAQDVIVTLTGEETQALSQLAAGFYKLEDLLITALSQALAPWTGSQTVLFDMMGHGREELFSDLDLSRTMGFFVSYTPKVLDLSGVSSASATLKSVTRQLHSMPGTGLDFDLLRYICQDEEVRQQIRILARSGVLFNYRGRRTTPPAGFRHAQESKGPTHSPNGLRYYPLSVVGDLIAEQLQVSFVYSENLHRAETVQTLADAFLTHLRSLIEAKALQAAK